MIEILCWTGLFIMIGWQELKPKFFDGTSDNDVIKSCKIFYVINVAMPISIFISILLLLD